MSFTEPLFLLIFLPLVGLLFVASSAASWRHVVLLAASCLFYMTTSPAHLLLLLGQVLWVHLIARSAAFPGSRVRLVAAIIVPLASLILHKYLAFLIQDVLQLPVGMAALGPLSNLLLPVGVSFYTFELISYAADRYRREIEQPASLPDLLLFISFFPHLAAGPILRFSQFARQLSDLGSHRLLQPATVNAIVYIICGLFLKLGLADSLARILAPLVARPGALTVDEALYLIFGFSFRIYFDFYAYSIMAIGMGLLLGIELPVNFRRPYEALNPRDFWQRWHISLSTWIRDYLYLPFGGNRAYVRNIIVVFALCGLWHGAGWNFVFWGLYHAALLIGYRAIGSNWDAMPALVQRILMFMLVSIGWLTFIFEIDGVHAAVLSLTGLGNASGPSTLGWQAWILLAASAVACWGWSIEKMSAAIASRHQWYRLAGGVLGSVFIGLLLLSSQSTTFIYFRF